MRLHGVFQNRSLEAMWPNLTKYLLFISALTLKLHRRREGVPFSLLQPSTTQIRRLQPSQILPCFSCLRREKCSRLTASICLQWPKGKKKNYRRSDIVRNINFVPQVQGIINANPGKSIRVLANQLHVSKSIIRHRRKSCVMKRRQFVSNSTRNNGVRCRIAC